VDRIIFRLGSSRLFPILDPKKVSSHELQPPGSECRPLSFPQDATAPQQGRGAGNDFRFWQTPSVEHLSLPPRSWLVSNQGSRLGARIVGRSGAGSLVQATLAAAGPDRSKHWGRSTPSLAPSAKAVPPASFPASAGLVPRSPARGTETIRPSPATESSATTRESKLQKRSVPPIPSKPVSVSYQHRLNELATMHTLVHQRLT
jgi:hypothetical protein